MPYKNLTDKEIVKALEDLKKCNNNEIDCGNCTLSEFYPRCPEEIGELALDLINHQKEEIEELKSAINGFRGYEDKIKAEAYKEFAEMLKEQCNCVGASLLAKKIDSLLIEMESEKDA